MRPSKFSDAQILRALQQVQSGAHAAQVCRSLGVTETTFYRWRKKYGDGAPNAVRQLRLLEVENQKLKQIVTTLMLEKERSPVPGARRERG